MRFRTVTMGEDGSDEVATEWNLKLHPATEEAARIYMTAHLDEANRSDLVKKFKGPKRVLLSLELLPELQAQKRKAG